MKSLDKRLTLLNRIIEVTTAQIHAARELQHVKLDELNGVHSDLLFEMTVAMQEPLPTDPELIAALKERAIELGEVQDRLATLAGSVSAILDRAMPANTAPTRTYSKYGRVRAA
tara:strand:- start:353 stop:694 length:342 start_codon:yes stop_codon:yes gene_type:complete